MMAGSVYINMFKEYMSMAEAKVTGDAAQKEAKKCCGAVPCAEKTAPLATKLKIRISGPDDFGQAGKCEGGALADAFDSRGNTVLKPLEVAEKLHPACVWFGIDAGSQRLAEHFREMSKLGCMGFENFGMLFSGVRDTNDIAHARAVAGEAGLNLGINAHFGVLVEYPSAAMLARELLNSGPSFLVVDVDSLSSKMLGDGALRRHADGIHASVLKAIENVARDAKKAGASVGAAGIALKNRETVQALVARGMDFLVASPREADAMRRAAIIAEKKKELEFLRDRIRMHLKSGMR